MNCDTCRQSTINTGSLDYWKVPYIGNNSIIYYSIIYLFEIMILKNDLIFYFIFHSNIDKRRKHTRIQTKIKKNTLKIQE